MISMMQEEAASDLELNEVVLRCGILCIRTYSGVVQLYCVIITVHVENPAANCDTLKYVLTVEENAQLHEQIDFPLVSSMDDDEVPYS